MSKANKKENIKKIIDSIFDLKEENIINLSIQIEEKINDINNLLEDTKGFCEFDLGKLLLFFKVHIQNLRKEIPKVIEKSKEIKNVLIENYNKEIKLLLEKIKIIKEKVDKSQNISNKREEFHKKNEESLNSKIESLNAEIESLKKNKTEKNLESNVKDLNKNIISIQNRDNYKSIIYIFLINSGLVFQSINGNVLNLINNNIDNIKIKKLLLNIYNCYDNSISLSHKGYKENIIEQLFPNNEYSNIIGDGLINEMKGLIYNYENNKNLEAKTKEKTIIDEKIENITKRIKDLQIQ